MARSTATAWSSDWLGERNARACATAQLRAISGASTRQQVPGMIFVGRGSLLSQAVGHALKAGTAVEAICCPVGDSALPRIRQSGVAIVETDDPAAGLFPFLHEPERKTVFSINNKHILPDALLERANFLNIHNGLVQRYRGISEVCVFAAICNDEDRYGVTLHRLLPGQKVDAGPVVDQVAFDIAADDGFSSVMTRSLKTCQSIFERNLSNIANRNYESRALELSGSAYSYRDVPRICASARPSRLEKAMDLGAFRHFFPKLAARLPVEDSIER